MSANYIAAKEFGCRQLCDEYKLFEVDFDFQSGAEGIFSRMLQAQRRIALTWSESGNLAI